MNVKTITIYPNEGQRVNWKPLREELATMKIGDTLELTTEEQYLDSAQESVRRYATANGQDFLFARQDAVLSITRYN
jgi:hypothetical protein